MKNLLKVFGLLLVNQMCFGQQLSLYEFEPIHTFRKLKEFKETPLVYDVDEVVFEKTIAVGLVPVLNQDYVTLEKKIKKLERDSVVYHNKISKIITKQNDLKKIKTLINDFMASPKGFESKKEKLIEAQKISDQYNLNELIYADHNINYEKKEKFMMLKIDKLDLKVHLKRVIWRVEDLFVPIPTSDFSVDERLKKLRDEINSLEKFNYKDGGYKKLSRKGMVIKNKVHNFKIIEGQFEQLGTYYILYNGYKKIYKQGEIVNHQTAVKNKLIQNEYTGEPKVLLKQTQTDKLYIAEQDFVNQYAFLINGKFNKGELPLEIYKKGNVVLSDD